MTSIPPTSFEALGLCPSLLHAVQAAGYQTPTPIQNSVIAAVLAGRDVRGCAATGSGKTAAFGLPLLQRLLDAPRSRSARGNRIAVLVLAPTRELVTQIHTVLEGFARAADTRLKLCAVFGGVSINPQMMELRGGADVLVATPGRLLDLQRQNALEFSELRTLVLDEADRMLGESFREELAEVLALLPTTQRQTLLFSATFPRDDTALKLPLRDDALEVDVTQRTQPDPTNVEPTNPVEPDIEQRVYTVDLERKAALLIQLLQQQELQQVLIFVSVKKTAEALVVKLNRAELHAAVFHGEKSQSERTRRLADFRSGKLRVLIATDLASRGIDIEDLPTVINFELPRSPNDYQHRIGRTGRAGKTGRAITLLCAAEEQHFRVIEKRIKRRLPREVVAGFEPRVLPSSLKRT